ncbi:MAG: PIN domain nuclease [Actinomycetota bacterium]|nr:PIN domain nuclease [Actinomycetota bacterium]
MAIARYLADSSALARWHHPPVRTVLAPLVEHGLIATCGITELVVLFSTRGQADCGQVAADRRHAYEWLPTEDSDLRRALGVQAELAARGQLGTASLPDLIIAAVAERHRVCILHYDGHYERVAQITGQVTRWVVPQGSLT